MAFYEEIAISVNSKVMSDEVAHYIFGLYAIKCSDSLHFWEGVRICKDSPYWSLFREFVEKMRLMQRELECGKTKLDKLKF